jgi:hypothetical protein
MMILRVRSLITRMLRAGTVIDSGSRMSRNPGRLAVLLAREREAKCEPR